MFSLKVESTFSSAHNLKRYKGKCEELHGHNWKVQIEVVKNKLDKAGMVLDFKDLKMKLNKVLDELDHKYLNNVSHFKKVNPTSENIARYIFYKIKDKGLRVNSVTVWESENSCATYYEE